MTLLFFIGRELGRLHSECQYEDVVPNRQLRRVGDNDTKLE